MSNRNHTYFNAAVVNGHPHTKQYIKESKTDKTHFIRTPCQQRKTKKSRKLMFFENLAGHLDSKAHREIINHNNEVDEAIKYLKTKP